MKTTARHIDLHCIEAGIELAFVYVSLQNGRPSYAVRCGSVSHRTTSLYLEDWHTTYRAAVDLVKKWRPELVLAQKSRGETWWGDNPSNSGIIMRLSQGDTEETHWTVNRTSAGLPSQALYDNSPSWEAAIEAGRAAIETLKRVFPEKLR